MSFTKEELDDFLCRNDLAYFAERVLSLEINDHHKRWSYLASKYNRLAINAARDHGKSYFFSFAYVIWRAYYGWVPELPPEFKSHPKRSLGYIFSFSQDQAIKFLQEVKNEIETNPKLAHLRPERKDVWSKMEIKLANGSIIRARGWGVAVRGAHPSWAVCDDVLTDESIYSEVTRNKQIDYFFSAVTPMVIPKGQIIVVGTPFHNEDLYRRLQENKAYFFKKFAAIDDNGKALWPSRYSKDMLDARKEEVGSTRFTREYLCVPISDESSLFPEKILRECYDEQHTMPNSMTPELEGQLEIYTGVDLAMSASIGADYTVVTTIGMDQFKNRFILDIQRKKGLQMSEQLKLIEQVYYNFRPRKILIEDNNFQRVFRDEMVRRTDLPVEGFTTTGRKKNSLEEGIPSMQILFENRKIVIPRKTERDRRLSDILVNELKCFTYVEGKLQGLGAHDDTVMSLWIAYEASTQPGFSVTWG